MHETDLPETDLESMNRDHKDQVEMINAVVAAIEAHDGSGPTVQAVDAAVEDFAAHTREHFSQERDQMLEKLKKLAITDGLTKLYNSRYFYKQLDLEVDRFQRYNHSLSLLLIDIDHFKEYNDTYGHLEGDKVLVRLGQIIKSCLRRMDTAHRYGGEEFTVILPETGCDEATIVADRIRSAIKAETFSPVGSKPLIITVSIGVTEYLTDERISAFVQRADKAMYLSKEQGRNRVSFIPASDPKAS